MIVPPWVYPASAAALLAIGFVGGWKVQSWRCDAEKLEAVQRAIKRAEEARNKVHEESKSYEQTRETGRREAAEREGTIRTIYRDVQVPGECAAPDSVRGLLDGAVRAANGDAASEPSG
jgi:hypothetical protein